MTVSSLLLALIAACSPRPALSPSPTPRAVDASAPAASRGRAPLSPSELAWEFAEQGRLRLLYIAQASEGNAYEKLLELNSSKGGLQDLAERAKRDGVKAVAASLADVDLKDPEHKDHPFFQDFLLVLRVGTYRHLGTVVDLPESGPVTIDHDEDFLRSCSALWLLPALEVGNPDVSEQLDHFRTYLRIARAICLDAATVKHYEAGLELQRHTLDNLSKVVRGGKLSLLEQREVIAGLQELVSSELELQAVLDTEYFLAVRRLQARVPEPTARKAEQDALAERFLAIRTLVADPKAAESGFALDLPPPVGRAAEEWAQEEDYVASFVRSRRALTQVSANKILAGLQAYRKANKAFPEKIAQLKPGFLSTIPRDWLSTSGEFSYQKTESGFTLSSVLASPQGNTGERIMW